MVPKKKIIKVNIVPEKSIAVKVFEEPKTVDPKQGPSRLQIGEPNHCSPVKTKECFKKKTGLITKSSSGDSIYSIQDREEKLSTTSEEEQDFGIPQTTETFYPEGFRVDKVYGKKDTYRQMLTKLHTGK